jgi:hypothetical protein
VVVDTVLGSARDTADKVQLWTFYQGVLEIYSMQGVAVDIVPWSARYTAFRVRLYRHSTREC